MPVQFTLPPDYGPDAWNNQASRLTALKQLGFMPRHILDIGAYHGYWAGLAQWIWPNAEMLSIEANEDCREQLAQKGRPFEIALLSSSSMDRIYNKCQTGCGEGNSLFKENSVFPFEQVMVRTKTLKEVVENRTFDFVKIDCQGAESSIMEGGQETIRAAQVVLLECQIQEYNQGAPFLIDVIKTMQEDYGFRLYDIVDSHYNSRNMLIQSDLLFATENSPLFSLKILS